MKNFAPAACQRQRRDRGFHLKDTFSGQFFQAPFHAEEFIAALSQPRFARYSSWAKGDIPTAIQLYQLNCAISEALYTPLNMLEVVLRNRIHAVASTMAMGDETRLWFDRPEFQRRPKQPDQIAKARRDLVRENKELSADNIIAALSFGYWITLLGPDYENLWQKGMHRIASTADGKGLKRKSLSTPLFKLRFLRNRIAHHEPVIHWDLLFHYRQIIQIIGYLSPSAAWWTAHHSNFTSVYPSERIPLAY